MSWPKRHWLLIELRAHGQSEYHRIVSRHWTLAKARVAADLAAESWRNARGEIKAGRARWDDATGWARRYPGGLHSLPGDRSAALARAPWISYFPMPLEDAGELADASS